MVLHGSRASRHRRAAGNRCRSPTFTPPSSRTSRPALAWTGGPDGTQSYPFLVEDPDVAKHAPFVRWVADDIPAGTTALPEGFSTTPMVTSVEVMKQGANDACRTGYYGMRPPIGDKPLTYNLMV